MSRSNPTADAPSNPANRFFEWQGSTGKVKYYDRETKENVIVDLPFGFIVLDQLNTITGYSDALKSGYWSNEIRDITSDKLVVRTSRGIEAEGVYKDIPEILAKGAKYAKSVYIAYKDAEGTLQIGNIKLYGSAIGPWIEFCKENNVNKIAVLISEAKAAKKGTTEYFTPVFTAVEVTEETDIQATALDVLLQDHLTAYLSRSSTSSVRSGDTEQDDEPGDVEEALDRHEESEEEIQNATLDEDGNIDLSGIKF